MGVRHDDVRVSVRAVDIFLSFAGSPPSAAGVSGGPSLCSGAQVGPKSYVLLLRLASVGSERTAVLWFLLPAVPGRVGAREGRFCHRDALRLVGQLDSVTSHTPPSQSPQSPPSDGCVETSKTRHPSEP